MNDNVATAPPSILSHVSLGTNDWPRAKAFYDEVLATLDIACVMEHPGAAAYGRAFPEFWIGTPHDGGRANVANGVHIGFLATSRAQVDAFHAKALALGAQDDGAPGPRPVYGEPYYGCFVRDLDGHKIEAMFWDGEAA
ncbi:MAG: VOC family protein [Comamonadaceae bacterium]|nr:MAG: VOC family protein [Comamonadaceae bacterium]